MVAKSKLLVEVKEPVWLSAISTNNFIALAKYSSPSKRPREDYYLLTLNPSLSIYKNVDFIDKRAVMCVDMLMNDKRLKLSREREKKLSLLVLALLN